MHKNGAVVELLGNINPFLWWKNIFEITDQIHICTYTTAWILQSIATSEDLDLDVQPVLHYQIYNSLAVTLEKDINNGYGYELLSPFSPWIKEQFQYQLQRRLNSHHLWLIYGMDGWFTKRFITVSWEIPVRSSQDGQKKNMVGHRSHLRFVPTAELWATKPRVPLGFSPIPPKKQLCTLWYTSINLWEITMCIGKTHDWNGNFR